jgi:two-component system, cell cycle sensor histidine kinase and response regulator CckA
VHAGQAAEGIENFFTEYNNSLSFLAINEHIISLDPEGRDLMQEFYTSHHDEISSITRMDEHGIITYTYPVESSIGANISSQSHVAKVLATHAVVISDVFTSVQGFRAVAFHMPVFENGSFRGSIAILIPFDNLAKENLGTIRVIDSGYAWAISRDGIILFSPDSGQIGKSVFDIFNSSPSLVTMVRQAISGSRGISAYTTNGDSGQNLAPQKFQAVYLPVTMGDTFWSIIVSTPENEILGTIEGFRNNLILISALLICSLLFFIYYVTRAREIVKEEEIRRESEGALRESEEFNRGLVENLPDIIAIYDRQGNVRFANRAGLKILGADVSDVIGQPILSFVVDDQREGLQKKMQERLSGMAITPYEVVITSDTGEPFTVLLKALPITYQNEQMMLVLMTDITEQKKREWALHENEQQLSSIFNTVGDIIFQLSVEPGGQYRFISVNSAFNKVTGLPAEQVLGKIVSEVIPGPSLPMVLEKYRQAILEKEIVRWEEASDYPTGQLVGEVSIAPIFDKAGRCIYLIGSVHDITERKRAEQILLEAHRDLERKVEERTRELSEANAHLQELDRLKSLFIASMSHELRTPLNSIIGFTGIMAKGLAGEVNVEQKKQLGMVQDSARHLLALINDVIDISKIEADKIEASISEFYLADVITEVKNTYGPTAREQGLDLVIENLGPIMVTSDQRRIKQIIMNLVSNAIKFTDKGRIDVTVEQKGTFVYIAVRDTGIGIGKEDLDQLFLPFGRIAVPGRITEGTGLGLYLSRKLARFLGGEIKVTSEPGQGSLFTFSFPIVFQEQGTS